MDKKIKFNPEGRYGTYMKCDDLSPDMLNLYKSRLKRNAELTFNYFGIYEKVKDKIILFIFYDPSDGQYPWQIWWNYMKDYNKLKNMIKSNQYYVNMLT